MTLKIKEFRIDKMDWRQRAQKPRVYIFPEGEGVFENLVNRFDRPSKLYRREVMPAVLEKMGLPADTKYVWNQYAGCSCGCSPGFIIHTRRRVEIYVTVEAEEGEDPMAACIDEMADHVRRLTRAQAIDADPTLPVSLTPEAKAFMEEVENATAE